MNREALRKQVRAERTRRLLWACVEWDTRNGLRNGVVTRTYPATGIAEINDTHYVLVTKLRPVPGISNWSR